MSPRLVLIGALVTVIMVVAAVVAVLDRPGPTAVRLGGDPAFPDLRARPDAVVRVVVADGADRVTLVRETGDGWTVAERAGWPAATDRVRQLIADLADMRLVEAKTAKPERFARLDVDEPDGDSEARRVRLDAANGTTLAEAILGRRVYASIGGREAGTYIRRAGDDRAWLASGAVTVAAAPAGWLETTIYAIPADSIRSVRVEPAEGAAYVVARGEPTAEGGGTSLTLAPLPAGRTAEAPALERLLEAVAAPTLEDVAPVADLPPSDAPTTVTVETEAGLRLVLGTTAAGESRWTTVEVAAAGDGTAAAAVAERVDGRAFRTSAAAAARLAPALAALLEPTPTPDDRP